MNKIIFALVFFVFLSGCSKPPVTQAQVRPVPLSPVEIISKITGAASDQSDSIYSIVEACGIIFEDMMADANLDNRKDTNDTGYWIKTPNVEEVRLYLSSDKTVTEIWYRQECMYSEGAVKKQLYDAVSGEYITLAEFNQLETDMSYKKVCRIIGGEGQLISAVDLGIGKEYKTEMYQWWGFNGNGSNAIVSFQGGKSVTLTQIGLE